ncbi:hypothetical protein EXIGLDRAFT_841466 [Exidia glandulosa HHB12029]|uniref:Uncharacterized protein n=1 Tax=Exidia glandulosa HHB12029 TaxID=1314781 RepID=A0A165DVY5_EXIGL|nr:hypothetical protein EXIGLDRAFT_841466 [Exidia glandulosa HHB12029]
MTGRMPARLPLTRGPKQQTYDVPDIGPVTTHSGDDVDAVLERMRAQFGKKFDDIAGKYGYVEFVRDGDDIVDVKPPGEFMSKISEAEVQRHLSGNFNGPSLAKDAGYAVSPTALKRLAQARMVQLAMAVHQLRHEPTIVRQLAEAGVLSRPHLLTPSDVAAGKTLQNLLSRPAAVAFALREEMHFQLARLGNWAHIAAYLEDAADMERRRFEVGIDDDSYQIGYLNVMNVVAAFVEDDMLVTAMNLCSDLVRQTKLAQYYPGGPQSKYLDRSSSVMKDRGLDGHFVKFLSWEFFDDIPKAKFTKEIKEEPKTWDALIHLLTYFPRATEEEKAQYPHDVMIKMYELLASKDFLDMLHSRSVGFVMGGHRRDEYKESLVFAWKIMERASLEKHIKNIDSLDRQSTLDKIWKDLDTTSMKMAKGKRIEQVLGLAELKPMWHAGGFAAAGYRPNADNDSDDSDEEAVAAAEPTPRKRRERPPRSTAQPEPEPAVVKPFWVGAANLLPADVTLENAPAAASRGPTNATATNNLKQNMPSSGSKNQTERSAPSAVTTPSLPLFRVPARVMAVSDRLFSRGSEKGQLKFADVEKALTSVGFTKEARYGSVVRFTPPDPQGIPFICHKPHGTDPVVSPVLQRNIAGHLNALYGWTKDWFGVKTPIPRLE